MFSLPFGVIIDGIQTTGSASVDGLGRLSVLLYDLLGDFGSVTIDLGN